MKPLATALLLLIAYCACSQTDSVAIAEIKKFQADLTAEFRNPKESPLGADAKKFKGHTFYPVDLKFRVNAKLITTTGSPFFKMKTSSGKTAEYRQYGLVRFSIAGKEFQVPIYQSQSLMKTEEYKDYLFLPFTDLTTGNETYSAGRYLGLRIPTANDELIIDFNQAYNPYCAYSNQYSCPIVPAENHLEVEILAGVKYNGHK